MSAGSTAEGATANVAQMEFRKQLGSLFANNPLSREEMMFNLGMFTRGSLLVKFLFMNEVYERVKDIPGVLIELGVWFGQNLVLLENLRAIHEPFNKQRIIVGFDTFAGYRDLSDRDAKTRVMIDDTYKTPPGYKDFLANLLVVHEGNNAFGHARGNHRLVEGDAALTVPRYLQDHPETLVALAFFDIG